MALTPPVLRSPNRLLPTKADTGCKKTRSGGFCPKGRQHLHSVKSPTQSYTNALQAGTFRTNSVNKRFISLRVPVATLAPMNTSGDRLKALLHECGLSASDFAAQRSVTPQHVNNWFNRGVPLARLDEMADLFCVHRRWLRTGEGPKHPNPIQRNHPPRQAPANPPSPLSAHRARELRVLFTNCETACLRRWPANTCACRQKR